MYKKLRNLARGVRNPHFLSSRLVLGQAWIDDGGRDSMDLPDVDGNDASKVELSRILHRHRLFSQKYLKKIINTAKTGGAKPEIIPP